MKEQLEECPDCNSSVKMQLRHCPSCGFDVGCPNVRLARSAIESEALRERFESIKEKSRKEGWHDRLEQFVEYVNANSSVVVAMPLKFALNFVSDEGVFYQNYEKLVGGGTRSPADIDDDRVRRVVAGGLFPSFASDILYGALSASGIGLETYGEIFVRLRPVSLKKRTTFLEENSYSFAEKFPAANKPHGYMADWEHRGELAAVKLAKYIASDVGEALNNIIFSDGKNRQNDDFIEAHIFDRFNSGAVESIAKAPNISSPSEKKLAEFVMEAAKESGFQVEA